MALANKKPEEKAPSKKLTASGAPNMLQATLVKGVFLRQPSTGIRMELNKPVEVKLDGWLKAQVDAKLVVAEIPKE